jgi:hypothetical protein
VSAMNGTEAPENRAIIERQAHRAAERARYYLSIGDRPAAEALLRLALTLEPGRLGAVIPAQGEWN